jgi:hypothetical protein
MTPSQPWPNSDRKEGDNEALVAAEVWLNPNGSRIWGLIPSRRSGRLDEDWGRRMKPPRVASWAFEIGAALLAAYSLLIVGWMIREVAREVGGPKMFAGPGGAPGNLGAGIEQFSASLSDVKAEVVDPAHQASNDRVLRGTFAAHAVGIQRRPHP